MKKQVIEEKEKTTIELKNRIVVLSLTPFDTDVNQDEFTTIHYHNLIGEILTISVALNRAGNLLAEMTEILSEAKLDMEIYEAQLNEEKRKELEFEDIDSKGNKKVKRA